MVEGSIFPQAAAVFIHRVAKFYEINVDWLLIVMQKEQNLTLDPSTRNPGYSVRRLGKPEDKQDGERIFQDRIGWLAVTGDWKMCAACGCGIPDVHTKAPWDASRFVGFDQQVANCGRLARRDLDNFTAGTKTVQIYGGEIVECADGPTYLALNYTPSTTHADGTPGPFGDVLVDIPKIAARMFSA